MLNLKHGGGETCQGDILLSVALMNSSILKLIARWLQVEHPPALMGQWTLNTHQNHNRLTLNSWNDSSHSHFENVLTMLCARKTDNLNEP